MKNNTDIIISLNIEVNIEKKSVPKIIISKENEVFSSRVNNSNNFNSNSIMAVKNDILGVSTNRLVNNSTFLKNEEFSNNISFNQNLEERLFEKSSNKSNISFDNINLESRRKLLNQINYNLGNNAKNNSNFINANNLSSINHNQFKTNETEGDEDLSMRIFNKNESSFYKGLREINKRVTSTSYINNLLDESENFTQNSLLEETLPRNFKDKLNNKQGKNVNVSIKRDSDSDTDDANNKTKRSKMSKNNNQNNSMSRINVSDQFDYDCFTEKQEKYKFVNEILNQLNELVNNLELENEKKKKDLKEMNKSKNILIF